MPEITKIVITGGPCAGKTTAMSRLMEEFTERGFRVLCVPEAATILISNGVSAQTCGSGFRFQEHLMRTQVDLERIFFETAQSMPCEKVLLLCDRGLMDGKAYVTEEEFSEILEEIGLNEVEARDGYDAVFHLVTAADGAEAYYTTANNAARTEGLEQAIALDARTQAAWTGQPHLRVIDNSTDFENKMRRLIKEISFFLGVPEPLEIERKYLIRYPDIAWLTSLTNCQRVEIVQTYLKSEDGGGVRVRQRGMDGDYVYIKTTKRTISDRKRVEVEERITEREYLTCLMDADPSRHAIRKTRYCFLYDNRYFELDVYPFWDDRAILELELSSEDEEVVLPKELELIREVTDDDAYKNASLAKNG